MVGNFKRLVLAMNDGMMLILDFITSSQARHGRCEQIKWKK